VGYTFQPVPLENVKTTRKEPSRHNAYAKFPEQLTGATHNHNTNISIIRIRNYGATEEHTSYT
jgi:hypothetical protein